MIKYLSAALLAVVVAFMPAAAATASTPDVTTVATSQSAALPAAAPTASCNSYDRDCLLNVQREARLDYLPLRKWSGQTSNIHVKYDQFLESDWGAAAAINIQQWSLGMANGLWGWTMDLIQVANDFTPLNFLGAAVDNMAGQLGKLLWSGPGAFIMPLILIFLLFAAIWASLKGRRGGWTRVLKAVVIAAVFMISTSAAVLSTTSSNGEFRPAALSPGWLVTTVNGAVEATTNSLVAAGRNAVDWSGDTAASSGSNRLSCDSYVATLNDTADTGLGSKTGIPVATSALWENTALQAWRQVQFGQTSASLSENVYCRLLEINAGTSPKTQMTTTTLAAGGVQNMPPRTSADSIVWGYSEGTALNNDDVDTVLIGWAACRWNGSAFTVHPDFVGKDSNTKVTPELCSKWWYATTPGDIDNSALDVSGGDANAKNAALASGSMNNATYDFLRALHGVDVWSVSFIIFANSISALTVFVIIGLIFAGMVALAKLATVLIILSFLAMLVVTMFKRENGGGLANLAKKFLGYSIISFAGSIMLMFVVWIIQLFNGVVFIMFAPGSPGALFFAALSPLGAVMVMHMVFTKVLKAPSPFTIKGMAAYATAGGAIGGAVGGAVGGGLAARAMGRGKQMASQAGNLAMNKVTGGKVGGPGAGARKGAATDTVRANIEAGLAKGNKTDKQVSVLEAKQGLIDAGHDVPLTRREIKDLKTRQAAQQAKEAAEGQQQTSRVEEARKAAHERIEAARARRAQQRTSEGRAALREARLAKVNRGIDSLGPDGALSQKVDAAGSWVADKGRSVYQGGTRAAKNASDAVLAKAGAYQQLGLQELMADARVIGDKAGGAAMATGQKLADASHAAARGARHAGEVATDKAVDAGFAAATKAGTIVKGTPHALGLDSTKGVAKAVGAAAVVVGTAGFAAPVIAAGYTVGAARRIRNDRKVADAKLVVTYKEIQAQQIADANNAAKAESKPAQAGSAQNGTAADIVGDGGAG